MSEWISVKDRLPEEDVDVLAWSPEDGVRILHYIVLPNRIMWTNFDRGWNDITHWMPLPEPPEDET